MSKKETAKEIKALLETPFWIDGLESGVLYQTMDDDSPDGQAYLQIYITPDGDVWANKLTDSIMKSIRKRTDIGGGRDHRTRTAMMILAYAMKLDEEERAERKAKYDNIYKQE